MSIKKFFTITLTLVSLLLICETILQASPLPTTGLSNLNQAKSTLAFSQMGFDLKLVSDEWVFLSNPQQKQQSYTQQLDLGFRHISESARLSFKIEDLQQKISLETYVKKYLKDYNQYGFDVLLTKSLILNNNQALLIDLKQKNNQTQARQVFFMKDKKIVMANCIDKIATFSKTAEMCNAALNTFTWKL